MLSLVTGSSGLLGGCLVSRLEERGHKVRLLDMVPPPKGTAASAHDFVRSDLSEPAAVDEIVGDVEVIYHLAAAQRMKPQYRWSEEEIFERNLAAARNVIDAALRCGARKLVFLSSSGVYGIPRELPCTEEHARSPLGSYGRSKLLAEDLCRAAVDRGLDVTVLRPMSIFGPRMTGLFVMLFEWIRAGLPVYMLGRGKNRLQVVSAWDVADACICAAEKEGAKGAVLNIGSEPETVSTVIQMVQAVIEHAGSGSPVVRIPAFALRNAARLLQLVGQSPIAPEHYMLADRDFILDIRLAKETLGWVPQRDNVRVLIEAYDWYVSAGADWRPQFHPIVRLLNQLGSKRSVPRRLP